MEGVVGSAFGTSNQLSYCISKRVMNAFEMEEKTLQRLVVVNTLVCM